MLLKNAVALTDTIVLIVAAGMVDSFLAKLGGGIRMCALARGKRWSERACPFSRVLEITFCRGMMDAREGLTAPEFG